MGGSAIAPGVIAEAVAAAKGVLRLASDAEDALLARLCESAILLAEAYCGATIVARTFEDMLGVGDAWQTLRARPVTAIAGVTGLPADGAPFVLAADAFAVVIQGDGAGRVRVIVPGAATRVAVSYSAGSADGWDAVAPPLAQGIAMLAAHLFDHREQDGAPPAAVAALWRPFRRLRLSGAGA